MRFTFCILTLLGFAACTNAPKNLNADMESPSRAPAAMAIEKITAADCKGSNGAYLRMDRSANTFEARFEKLPKLTNFADGERMPIEFSKEAGYEMVGTLTASEKSQLIGSVFLTFEKGKPISRQMDVLIVFRDMAGDVRQDTLSCNLAGI